jgi:pyruvate kinase
MCLASVSTSLRLPKKIAGNNLYAIENGVDFIAHSVCTQPDSDVLDIRSILNAHGQVIFRIISKR